MNKKIILFAIVFFLCSTSIAKSVEIIVPETSVTVYAGQSNELEIPVKNDGDSTDTFYFSIWPTEWVAIDKYWVALKAGETGEISFTLTPPVDAEEETITFTITVTSVSTKESYTEQVYLDVKRKTRVFISELKLNKQSLKPGDTLIIQPIITNLDKKETHEVYVTTKILKDGLIVQKFEDSVSIEPESKKTLTNSFEVRITNLFGSYEIIVTIRDSLNEFVDESKSSFKIKRVYDVFEEKSVKYGFLCSVIEVKITNRGNVPRSGFSVTESVPMISKYFFYPEVEPTYETKKDNRIVYGWSVEVDPGETKAIKYQFRFINIALSSGIVIVAIIIIFWFMFKPTLSKSYRGILAGQNEIKVLLSIKNKTRKQLNNVIVTDFVPPIARVIREFQTLVPEITRKQTGTGLKWKISKLKPIEERIITYKIKPVIEITGELKLPKSHFTYETRKGKKKMVASKSILIKAKVK